MRAVVRRPGPADRLARSAHPDQRRQLQHGRLDHRSCSLSDGTTLLGESFANNAESSPWILITDRGWPAPLPAGPWPPPTRRSAGWPDQRVSVPATSTTPATRHDPVAYATRLATTSTGPHGASTRPYRSCPAGHTRPGRPACTGPCTSAGTPAPGPADPGRPPDPHSTVTRQPPSHRAQHRRPTSHPAPDLTLTIH